MTQITKGYWYTKSCPCSGCDVVQKIHGHRDWIIWHPHNSDGRFSKADAHLIVASPKLYEACLEIQEARDNHNQHGTPFDKALLDKLLDEAIALVKLGED